MKLITLLGEIDCEEVVEIHSKDDMIVSGYVADIVDWMYQTKSDIIDTGVLNMQSCITWNGESGIKIYIDYGY